MTRPAYFNDFRKSSIIVSASAQNFAFVRVVLEPQATIDRVAEGAIHEHAETAFGVRECNFPAAVLRGLRACGGAEVRRH